MKKIICIIMFILLICSTFSVLGEDENGEIDRDAQIKAAKENAKELQKEIEMECREDPYSCSCEKINCEEIKEVDDPKAKEGYDKCKEGKESCESQRKGAIKEIEETKAQMIAKCKKNIDKCDCNDIKNDKGKQECETALIDAKYQAQKEKAEKIKECSTNLDSCDCSTIENEEGRAECEKERDKAFKLREKIKKACEKNPLNCDCDSIENENGKKQCKEESKKGYEQATSEVKTILSKCFIDIDKCDCENIGLQEAEKKSNTPEGSFVTFCETQLSYGLNCKYKGIECEKLEDIDIYPYGLPEFLRGYFKKEYKSYIDKEKEKASRLAVKVVKNCINDPNTCDCSPIPDYAKAFCERQRDLQIKCYAEDYDACVILDESPNLPPGLPPFIESSIDKLVAGLRSAREGVSKSNAARKVGNMILECMDDSSKCDCSIAPQGKNRAFCEHKKDLVIKCKDQKIYDACFTLDEEPVVTDDVPDFIKSYVEKNIVPKVNEKKQKMFDEMKIGTTCNDAKTIAECKSLVKA